jgi:hypothetical protein
MHVVEGFDLSPFNKLARPCYSVKVGDDQLTLRSAPADLFSFDFQSGGPFPEARATVTLEAFGGRVNGIAQWNFFQIDNDGWYENRPSVGVISAFEVLFFPLMQSIELKPGDALEVCGAHDRRSLRIWAEAP